MDIAGQRQGQMINVSVIIPAKNRAKKLPACLDSVLAQTLPPAEVIVIDDSSTDNSREVVESYGSRGVKYVRLQHGSGAQAARNMGIRLASYDWIAFQDSDDIWFKQKLESQVNKLKQLEFDVNAVIHCDGLRIEVETGMTKVICNGEYEGYCYPILLIRPGPMFQGMLVSKSALQRIGYLDEKCPAYQEWDTSIQLSQICTFVHIEGPLFEWRRHDEETISKDARLSIRGYQYVLEKHKQQIITIRGQRAWRQAKVMNLARALRHSLWDEAQKMADSEAWHPSFLLARIFASLKYAPPGIARLLRVAAL